MNSLSPLSLPFYFRCFRHLIALMTLCWTCPRPSMSLLYGEPKSGPNTPGVLSPVLIRGTRISSGTTLPKAAQEVLDYFATRTHCWSMVSLCSRTLMFPLAKLLPVTLPQIVLGHGIILLQAQGRAFSPTELHESPLCPVLQPVQIPLNDSTTISATPLYNRHPNITHIGLSIKSWPKNSWGLFSCP